MSDKKLTSIYYNLSRPESFSSLDKLVTASRPSQKAHVRSWLESQATYTIHRAARKQFPTNFYRVLRPDQTWECDLVITQNIADENKPFTCLLTVIDTFDRFAWVEPLREKSAKEVVRGFLAILKRSKGRKPVWLQSDSGKEFTNRQFQRLLGSKGIRFRETVGKVKAAIVERFNRTLRDKLWRVFYYRGSYSFRDVLQKIVDGYNESVHSETGLAPAKVRDKDVFDIYMKKYVKAVENVATPRFKVGQYVRLVYKRTNAFDRGYTQKYTEEVFRVARVQTQHRTGLLPRPVYHLVDLRGDPIFGAAYEQELSPIIFDPKTARYKIEAVEGERRNKKTGEVEFYIKWLGYPRSMNEWLPKSAVEDERNV